jgi:hydroxyacylglutathione hydrolase
VIDLRDQVSFGAAHIPRAFGIGAGRMLSMWAGWVVPYDTPLLLVGPSDQIPAATLGLLRVGLDQVEGYLSGGISAWESARFPVAAVPQLRITEVMLMLRMRRSKAASQRLEIFR